MKIKTCPDCKGSGHNEKECRIHQTFGLVLLGLGLIVMLLVKSDVAVLVGTLAAGVGTMSLLILAPLAGAILDCSTCKGRGVVRA